MSVAVISGPETVEDLRIRRSLLEDLALKILSLEGEMSVCDLGEKMRIPLPVADEIFQHMRKDKQCEVKGIVAGIYMIVITSQGRSRARELFALSQYAGPTPVSLEVYTRRVREQSVQDLEIRPHQVEQAFEHLVLSSQILKQLGTAVVSGTTIFLHGPSGTGKTAIAETLPRIYDDHVWLPYAVEIDGQIITVYDPGIHERSEEAEPADGDRRWVLCSRPRVIVGGELTTEMLDLQFNPLTKFYSAPLQMKANNGVLIVDDFGRQRMQPEEMLNRWIVPLDRRIDFLTLAGGKSFEIPFDLFVVFATNLDPAELMDEAFLRRILNKIKVDFVTRENFHEIFRSVCRKFEVTYDAGIVDHFLSMLTTEIKQPLRACFPRDIVRQICWAAKYEGRTPVMDQNSVREACENYFLSS